jgi:hypothetical protein
MCMYCMALSLCVSAQGIARAHVLARSGNALLSYRLDKFVVLENAQKNHSYCVLALSGYVGACT